MPERTERPSAAGIRRRACTNCTVGKAKCSPFSSNECERCHRLGKDCHYASLVTTRKRPQPNSRLQVLERKIEELAAKQEYQSHQPQGSMSTQLFHHDTGSSMNSDASQWSSSGDTSSGSGLVNRTMLQASSIKPNDTKRETGDIVDRGVITQELSQVLLDRFRANATQQFPFVIIPDDTSLEAVRKGTPILFLAVMATMMFDNPFLQHQLGEEVRQEAFQRMLAGTEKSLDLLQGLLIYTSWYCHFYRADRHQELLLSQICVTIAHELGIDKSKKRETDRFDQCKPVSNVEPSSSLANAQMRAYLGTYCVSCLVATILRRRTALSYTKYMDYCCRSLAEFREHNTDELIPYLVRSQEISRRIVDTFSYDDINNGEIRGEFLINLASNGFLRDLERLRIEVPPTFRKNALLDFEFHIIRIMINEAGLHEEFWICSNDSYQDPDTTSSPLTRSKMLWRCLNSCKDFIQTFLSYQNQDLFYLTAFVYPRLCYVFIILAKMVALDSGSRSARKSDQSDTGDSQNRPWNTMNIAREANFQMLGKQVLEKFTAVAINFVGVDGERDAMSNLAHAMRLLLAGYEQQMNVIQEALQSIETSNSATEMAHDPGERVDSTPYLPVQEIDDDGSGSTFDTTFAWDSSASIYWDDIMENFTMVPF